MSKFKVREILYIEDVTHLASAATKFLVSNSTTNDVEYRTESEVLSDIGALSTYNHADNYAFKTIRVAGQSNVVADSNTDTLTLVAGTNMTITTNASGDTITFAASGGGNPIKQSWILDISRDEYTYIAVGNDKYTFRVPIDCTLVAIKFWLTRPPTGADVSLDIMLNGTVSLLNTNAIINNGDFYNMTPVDLATNSLVENDLLRFDIDQVGSSAPGTGLKCAILYTV